MDEIQKISDALVMAISEYRDASPKPDEFSNDELDDEVCRICNKILEASQVYDAGGCALCKS